LFKNDRRYFEGLKSVAILKLDATTYLDLFTGFDEDFYFDYLVHMKYVDDTYGTYQLDFVCQDVLNTAWL
jgi:hypothetical protein